MAVRRRRTRTSSELAGGEGEGLRARDGARREEGRRRSEARSEVEITEVEITEEAAFARDRGQRP